MDSQITWDNPECIPFILTESSRVVKVSDAFVDLTGYPEESLLRRHMSEVFKILKMNPGERCFLFTQTGDPRFISLSIHPGSGGDEKLYQFFEKPGSRLENKFSLIEQFYQDNRVGIGIYSAPDLTLLRANQQYLDFLDEPYNKPENSIGRNIREIVTEWAGSQSNTIWNTVLDTGKVYYVKEFMYDRFERGVTYWDAAISPIFENGGLLYIVENATEVTDRVLGRKRLEAQEKAIEQQKDQLEAIIENMADGLIIIDRDNNYIKVNKTIRNWLSQVNASHIRDTIGRVRYYDLNGSQIDYNDLPGTRIVRGERIEQLKVQVKGDGIENYVSVSGIPVYDDMDNFSVGVLNIRDITEQVNFEKVLKTRNDYLFRMIDTLNLPISWVSYPGFNIVALNRKAYDLVVEASGENVHSQEPVIGRNLCDLFPSFKAGINYESICRMAKIQKCVYLKDMKLDLNGREGYYNFLYQPILGLNGEIQELLIVGVDVTDEILQKQDVEKAMKIQEEFFSYIAHEFKTPLTTMNSAIQFMELIYDREMTENVRKNLTTIKRNIFQQLRLVNNLLDITKAEAGYLKVNKRNLDITDVTEAITKSIYQFAKAKDIRIEFTSSIKKKIIAIDDEKYERILLNLLSNAIKYTGNGKSIYISVSSVNDKVYVSVKDEGAGIPQDKLEVIFERFGQAGGSLTRQSEGTGIGLCLVRLLVKAMDGDITVESTEGEGSTFTLILPDRTVQEDEGLLMSEFTDGRLIRALNVEFSNIYLD